MRTQHVALTLALFVTIFDIIQAAKILLVAFDPARSHANIFKPIINGLIDRGHELTAIVTVDYNISSKNFTQIPVLPKLDFTDKLNAPGIFERNLTECNYRKRSVGCLRDHLQYIRGVWDHGYFTTEHALKSKHVRNLLRDKEAKFDLVIVELYLNEPMYLLAHRFNAPLVLISCFDYDYPLFDSLGKFSIFSHIPQLHVAGDRNLGFFDRFIERALTKIYVWDRKRKYIHWCNKIAFRFFNKFAPLPSIFEIEKKASLVMFNTLKVLDHQTTLTNKILDISRIHIPKRKPLPADIQKFLDDAEEGAIYVSFGSIVKCSKLPKDIKSAFINGFGRLKIKVLWKYENETEELPKNILRRKWFPQNDILDHPNIKAFITHGGISGIHEGILHGVPMVVIPIFGDQFYNGIKVEDKRIGTMCRIEGITPDILVDCVKQVVSNPEFSMNIRRYSDIFRNDPTKPLDNALFWIEHVIKFRGAYHLIKYDDNVSWYEYLFLDFLFYIVLFVGSIYITIRKKFYLYLLEYIDGTTWNYRILKRKSRRRSRSDGISVKTE